MTLPCTNYVMLDTRSTSQDPAEDMTVGLVLPPLTPPSDEYIVQVVFPVSYGWTGVSMGGQMSNSLLFPLWAYDTNKIMVGPRWTEYVLAAI